MDAERTYDRCVAEGNVIEKEEIDLNLAKSILDSTFSELKLIEQIKKLSGNVSSHLFKTYYDILRELAQALLHFDKVEVKNHICLFSYLVVKHPDLEFDWQRLDEIRRLRNRICYYGK